MTNEELLQRAEDAINELHGDTSVSLDVCLENLQQLGAQLGSLIEAVTQELLSSDDTNAPGVEVHTQSFEEVVMSLAEETLGDVDLGDGDS